MASFGKVFVTGGAGFIGSHLVDQLLADGNYVTVYDNLASGKEKDVASHFGDTRFQFVKADLLDSGTLTRAMQGHNLVWHLGANTDIPGGNRQTDLDLKNCTIATWNVLEGMRALGIKDILFASSATVYGDVPAEPLSESFGPLLPISLYGAGKLACEGLISAYSQVYGIHGLIFRFANVVGARMGHGVIYDFIQKLRRNPRELEILGDGKQEKPFFLVEDCIDGMTTAYQRSKTLSDVFNLGCESYSTVDNIARTVIKEAGLKDVSLRYTGGKRGWPGDVPVVHFDVSKMKKLGWKAHHTSDEAVRVAACRLLQENG